MSFELIYTSAPRGLREGSSGFCTVASTEGIPQVLVKKLESLSGYQHAYPANSGRNPVNHAHCAVRVQQKVYHVLSRIADAGDDHTGRSNKIAHHLAIPASQVSQFSGGPLSLLADPKYWCQDWNREPRTLPPGRMPRPASMSANGFDAWEAIFGDAGWAGLLGEAAQSQPKPVCIIVPSADDSWDLLAEAMQLVTPNRRWKIGFNTYFNQAAGEGIHWRFILDGTEAARKFRGRSAALVIDHRARKSLPGGNPFVEAARSGDPSRVHSGSSATKASTRTAAKKPGRSAATAPRTRASPESPRRSGPNRQLRPSELRRRQAGQRARQMRQQYSDDDWDDDAHEDVHDLDLASLKTGDNRKKKLIAIVSAIVMFLAAIGLLIFYLTGNPDSSTDADDSATEVKTAE